MANLHVCEGEGVPSLPLPAGEEVLLPAGEGTLSLLPAGDGAPDLLEPGDGMMMRLPGDGALNVCGGVGVTRRGGLTDAEFLCATIVAGVTIRTVAVGASARTQYCCACSLCAAAC